MTREAPAEKGFGRHLRLTKASEYRRVFEGEYNSASNKIPGGGGIVVRARKNGLQYSRLGLVISKKSVKTAVNRNRVKRLVRESFRQHQERLCGLDVVVMSRLGLADMPNSKLSAILTRHWENLVRWKNSLPS